VFHVTNIYGPAATFEKAGFISWLYNFDTSLIGDWLILGDFNLIQTPANRNRIGGSTSEMFLFNDPIQHLDLVEIPFQGKEQCPIGKIGLGFHIPLLVIVLP
jgi:hypothetical protein